MKRSSLAVLATLAALPLAVIASAAISTTASPSAPAAHTSATTLADTDDDSGPPITVTVPALNVTANGALIRWKPVKGYSGAYEVAITDSAGRVVDIKPVSGALSYTTTALEPGRNYTATVTTQGSPQSEGSAPIQTPADPDPAG